MAAGVQTQDRPSAGGTSASNISSIELVADEVNSLLNPVDSEPPAEKFGISIYTDKQNFESHVKVVFCNWMII
jgi:hypothetical protein